MTHLSSVYGPEINCIDCHGSNKPPLFVDGNNLATTTVCDNCHRFGQIENCANNFSAQHKQYQRHKQQATLKTKLRDRPAPGSILASLYADACDRASSSFVDSCERRGFLPAALVRRHPFGTTRHAFIPTGQHRNRGAGPDAATPCSCRMSGSGRT